MARYLLRPGGGPPSAWALSNNDFAQFRRSQFHRLRQRCRAFGMGHVHRPSRWPVDEHGGQVGLVPQRKGEVIVEIALASAVAACAGVARTSNSNCLPPKFGVRGNVAILDLTPGVPTMALLGTRSEPSAIQGL